MVLVGIYNTFSTRTVDIDDVHSVVDIRGIVDIDDVHSVVDICGTVDANLERINGRSDVFFNNPSLGEHDKYYRIPVIVQ